MVQVVLEYMRRGATLLRLDAIGYLWKEIGQLHPPAPDPSDRQAVPRRPGRRRPGRAIVTETNVPHADNISYFGNGHDEAQMVYQFPLAPLVLHALFTGDASQARRLGRDDLETPSNRTTFFNFEASHDGVGVVPARGILTDDEVQALADRVGAHGGEVSYKTNPDGSESPYELNATLFDILSNPNDASEPWETKRDRFLCSQAIMLALAGRAPASTSTRCSARTTTRPATSDPAGSAT